MAVAWSAITTGASGHRGNINAKPTTTPYNASPALADHGLVRHPNDGDGVQYTLTPLGERALPALRTFVANCRSRAKPAHVALQVVEPLRPVRQ